MAKANTYELEKAAKVKCKICGLEGSGYYLWYYPTFMNGDAEVEAEFCLVHKQQGKNLKRELEAPIKAAEKRKEEEYLRYEVRKQNRLQNDFKVLEGKGFEVKKFTDYQYRINKVLDIFPTSQYYHDIKNNKRGDYRNLIGFVESFFKR